MFIFLVTSWLVKSHQVVSHNYVVQIMLISLYTLYVYIIAAEINTLCHLLNNNSEIENKSSLRWKQHRSQTIHCHVYMNVSIIVITFYLLHL